MQVEDIGPEEEQQVTFPGASSITGLEVDEPWKDTLEDCLDAEYYASGETKYYCNTNYDEYPLVHNPPDLTDLIHIVSFDETYVHWKLDLMPEGSIKSITSGPQVFIKDHGYKHRHDYVARAISMAATDVMFKEVFGEVGDEFDVKSPDIMVETEDFFHFIELTTRAVDEPRIVQSAFDEKIFTYDMPLRSRSVKSRKNVSYSIIVVTPSNVYSTISLPGDLVDELIVRMRISLVLEDKAVSHGLNLKTDEREEFKDNIKMKIKKQLDSIDFNDKDSKRSPFYITSKYVRMIREPANPEVFERILLRETKMCKERMGPREVINHDPMVKEFVNLHTQPDRRRDQKPIHPIPWFPLPQEDEFTSDVPVIMTSQRSDKPYLSKLWQAALQERMINPDFKDEDQGEIIRLACGSTSEVLDEEDYRAKGKKKYHRVDIGSILSKEEQMELAEQGVWAKKYDKSDFLFKRQQEQKRSFCWTTDTTDIEAYLEDDTLLDDCSPPKRHFERDLLREADRLIGNSPSGIAELERWENTKLFRCLDVESAIAFELAVANKQNCRAGTMILKKVRGYKILMLISPTKSDEHLFYSLLFYGARGPPLHRGVFGKPIKCGLYWMTDFASVKTGKLENMTTMQGSLLGIASYASYYHGLPDASPKSFKEDALARKTLLTLLAVRLEDKSVTEQSISQVRYMYMEIFKSNYAVSLPNPFAILKKIPEHQRSRLSICLVKKIVDAFLRMTANPPERVLVESVKEGEDSEEIDPPKDSWSGLVDWVTGGIVTSASKVVNLFYYGYLTNKNKAAEGNTDFQILSKTIEEEKNFDKEKVEESMGECNDQQPKGKQFSHEAIRLGADILTARLKSKFGANWEESVGKGIMKMLSERMTEEIASLKASCSEVHSEKMEPSAMNANVGAKRVFVIEAITHILNKVKLNPMTNLTEFIKFIEKTTKVVIADLFKKPQFGGLREIYVLTIESRIIQLFIESISRYLCSLFPEETLTHPKNKMKILDDHRVLCTRKSRSENRVHADYCSSTDKTRWNQNFVMSAMIIPLVKLTPECFHAPIQRCLNMWVGKLVKIPQRVINLLLSETPLSSPIYEDLLEDFWKKKDHKLVNQEKGRFLRLESGMMQGILHFTSSLLHLCYLSATSAYIPRILKTSFPEYDFRMTQACSSDDSATILTVFSPINTTQLSLKNVAVFMESSRMLHVLTQIAPYFCMIESPKSNRANLDYVEYNSEFTFKNTIAAAIVKLVGASFGISESECFNERFHTQYNLISDLFASGFPAYNTHLVQLSQGYIHYLTMGSKVNPCFPKYTMELSTYPDPALGFFLTDTEFAPGALGFSYSHWNAACKSRILNQTLSQKLSECGFVNETGGVTNSVYIRHGEVTRWKTLVKNVVGTLDLQTELDNNPELLFRPSVNMKELKIKLAAKVTTPEVSKSLRKGNAFMQALASSVYAVSTHCYTKITVNSSLNKVSKDMKKVSLLSEIISRRRDESTTPSESSMAVSFPSWERYKSAEQLISRFRGIKPTRRQPYRYRRSVLTVQPMNQLIPLNLQDTCCKKWFGWKVRASGEVARRCWEIYKEKLPWLRDTFNESLEESPFTTAQQLANLIKSQRFKTRRFSRIGPAMTSRGFRGQLIQLCKRSYKEGMVLLLSKQDISFVDRTELQTKVALALTMPEVKKEDEVRRILSTYPSLFKSPLDSKLSPKREAALGLIQLYQKNNSRAMQQKIVNTVLESGSGVIISYIRPQIREEDDEGKVTWTGPGLCVVRYSNTLFSIHMLNREATKIHVGDWESLRLRPSILAHVLNELNLKPAMKSGSDEWTVAKFNGTSFVNHHSLGCPVYCTDDLLATPASQVVLTLKVKRQSLILYQYEGGREFEFLRYTARPGDITQLKTSTAEKDPNIAWMSQSPLDRSCAIALLRDYSNHSETVQEWIRESLRARLSHKCVGSKCIAKQLEDLGEAEAQDDMDLVSDEFLDQFLDELYGQEPVALTHFLQEIVVSSEGAPEEVDLNAALSKDMEEPWRAALHGLMDYEDPEEMRLHPKTYKDIKYLHPFWDKLIEGPLLVSPSFWIKVEEGTVPTSETDLANTVMKILKVKPARTAQTLMQMVGKDVVASFEPVRVEVKKSFRLKQSDFPPLEEVSDESRATSVAKDWATQVEEEEESAAGPSGLHVSGSVPEAEHDSSDDDDEYDFF